MTWVYGRTWPPAVYAHDDTVQANISATSYTAGSPVVGVVFRAPPTGRVAITVGGACRDNTNDNRAFIAPAVYQGSNSAGTAVLAPDYTTNGYCSPGSSANYMFGSRTTLLEGLSEARDYYAQVMHFAETTTSASADIWFRDITVEPAP